MALPYGYEKVGKQHYRKREYYTLPGGGRRLLYRIDVIYAQPYWMWKVFFHGSQKPLHGSLADTMSEAINEAARAVSDTFTEGIRGGRRRKGRSRNPQTPKGFKKMGDKYYVKQFIVTVPTFMLFTSEKEEDIEWARGEIRKANGVWNWRFMTMPTRFVRNEGTAETLAEAAAIIDEIWDTLPEYERPDAPPEYEGFGHGYA